MKLFKTIALIIASVLVLCCLSSCSGEGTTDNSASSQQASESKELTIGDTFVFDDLEVTLGDYTFVKIDNEFSDHDKADVIEIPVTVKNIGEENNMLNPFFIKAFGSAGTQLDDIGTYFDNDAFSAGEMRSGATQQTFLHVLYDGDGDYYLNFEVITDGVEVKIPVKKN